MAAEFKFDKVGVHGNDQADAAERLKQAIKMTKLFTARELKRLVEVTEKEPMKIAFAKKAIGL